MVAGSRQPAARDCAGTESWSKRQGRMMAAVMDEQTGWQMPLTALRSRQQLPGLVAGHR